MMDTLVCVRVLFSSRRCFRQKALARTAPLLEHRVPYEGSVEAAIRVFPKGMPNNGLLRTLTKVSLLSPSERRLILTRLSPTRREWRRKFALSQNSKSLHAGSNPSERTLIIRGIVMASASKPRNCSV
jgi:hypothetical protein